MVSARIMRIVLAGILLSAANSAFAEEMKIKDITWQLGPNLPEFRKGGCSGALDGKVISVFGMRQPWGEMATMYVYDPQTNWWSRAPEAPVGQCYVQGTECGDAFYSIGGRGALQRGRVHPACLRLTIRDGRYGWTRIQDLNEPRGWAPSTTIGSRLYVFGGSLGGHGPCLSSVEMLDTADPQANWEKIADIPGESRGWLGAAAVKDKIYVFGGTHFFEPKPTKGSDRKGFKDVFRFDPATGQWQNMADLPYHLAGMDSCVYKNRYIIVVGGHTHGDMIASDYAGELMELYTKNKDRNNIPMHKYYYCPFVLIYDTQTDKWHRMPSLLPYATNDIRVVLIENKLYAVAGETKGTSTGNTACWLRIGTIIEE